jgi:CRP/FNR family transcriptional regulator
MDRKITRNQQVDFWRRGRLTPDKLVAEERGQPSAVVTGKPASLKAPGDGATPAASPPIWGTLLEVGPHWPQLPGPAVTFAPGQRLFSEGDLPRHAFAIVTGAVKVHKILADGRCQILRFGLPGDVLGISCDSCHSYGADAIGKCTAVRFSLDSLNKLAQRDAKCAMQLFELVRSELLQAQRQIVLLGRQDAMERIAWFLLMLDVRAAQLKAYNGTVALPMAQREIGDFLGLTTETVSRTLHRLKQSGMLSTDRGRSFRVLRRDALEAIAEGRSEAVESCCG